MSADAPIPPSASAGLSSVEAIEHAIEAAMARLEAEHRKEAAEAAAAAKHKQSTTRRVSISALLLTMMLSFLGFVRAQTDSAEGDDKLTIQQARSDAATEWALYQTKTAQRSGFIEAEDTLAREVLTLGPNDPRRRLVRFHHHEYEARVRLIDDENRQVFHRIQSLDRLVYITQRDQEQRAKHKGRYDMAIRTLTLALVLISVTLLVDRAYLFWFGLLVAAIGAAFGMTGYFVR